LQAQLVAAVEDQEVTAQAVVEVLAAVVGINHPEELELQEKEIMAVMDEMLVDQV
jgi:hypothetical protein